jgi:hypothetical protein
MLVWSNSVPLELPSIISIAFIDSDEYHHEAGTVRGYPCGRLSNRLAHRPPDSSRPHRMASCKSNLRFTSSRTGPLSRKIHASVVSQTRLLRQIRENQHRAPQEIRYEHHNLPLVARSNLAQAQSFASRPTNTASPTHRPSKRSTVMARTLSKHPGTAPADIPTQTGRTSSLKRTRSSTARTGRKSRVCTRCLASCNTSHMSRTRFRCY